jgi:hypothetical protein
MQNLQALPRGPIVLQPVSDVATSSSSLEAVDHQPDPSLQERIVINVRDAFVAPPGYVLLVVTVSCH